MTLRERERLEALANRYVLIDDDIRQMSENKEKLGKLLKREMQKIKVKKIEGIAMVILEKGDRITDVDSFEFYQAVPTHLRRKAWTALSVLIGKAQKLVGRDTLEELGRSVPFVRLVIRDRKRRRQRRKEAA